MSGGKRAERITERDLEVLEFVARFGMVPREVVGLWAGTGRAVTAARERRLREAGLVEVLPGVGGSGRLVLCKRSGLQAVGRDELSTPRLSLASVHHSAVVARVAAQLERAGQAVLSEREIQARERAEAKRIYSASSGEAGYHRPDLVLLPPEWTDPDQVSASDWGAAWPNRSGTQFEIRPSSSASGLGRQGSSSSRTQGGRRSERTSVREQADRTEDTEMRRIPGAPKPIAVEVELTAKAARRLAEILRAWRRAVARGQFGSVRYLCSPPVLPYLERALRGSMLKPAISVEGLQSIEGKLTLAPQSLQRVAGARGALAHRPAI
jgi:hypothetical protein